MPLNDLDCCLITIQLKKIRDKVDLKHQISLPFTDMKVNLYSFTVQNKIKEIRVILFDKIKKRSDNNHKMQESKESTK